MATALSQAHDSPAISSRPKRSLAARAGLVLMGASFLVYVVYGLLPFLGLEGEELAGAVIGASLASWGLFSLGVALAGRDVVPYFRSALATAWRRLGAGRRG